MQKMLPTIKHVIIFLVLALTIPWLNMAAFFALVSSDPDEETSDLLKHYSEEAFNIFYFNSLWAFILTYIIARVYINRRTNHWFWRILWYILTDIICFFVVCFLP